MTVLADIELHCHRGCWSPEQQMDKEDYTNAVDVWAYGVLLVRLFTLSWPYPPNVTTTQLKIGIARNKLQTIFIDKASSFVSNLLVAHVTAVQSSATAVVQAVQVPSVTTAHRSCCHTFFYRRGYIFLATWSVIINWERHCNAHNGVPNCEF